jgi:mRNA interferase YafQ
MYKIATANKYKKSLIICKKRGYNIEDLNTVIALLQKNDNPLPPKYKDHKLKGRFSTYRECHIAPDWLLIYRKTKKTLILLLVDTGKHNDLFDY